MQNQPSNQTPSAEDLNHVTEAVVNAILKVGHTQDLEEALIIRNELRRLPDQLLTEILNQVILRLVPIDPLLCRWFIIDVFLRDAPPEGRADVAERINILLADLQSSQSS
ncbi:hypothetical protein [Leptolyngbya ohadii]|uniref:hypothetical protein n=1 Tax=Leptolyngbya ohadii TaxID=1962290 RepID=UPI0015C5DEB7|nr:hypothetical protein [Leptolyngbya ohadii]